MEAGPGSELTVVVVVVCMCLWLQVGLTGFSCRCNPDAVFCSHHRYAEAHDCQFDYKGSAQQRLKEANPVVQASKLQKF
jgi:hypothetical protein